MTRRVFLSLALALSILALVGAAETGYSLSSSQLVFDTAEDDSDYENLTSATFGAGKTSETVIVYLQGVEDGDTTLVSRSINTTLVLNGTTPNAIKTAKTSITNIISITSKAGNGYLAFTYTEEDSDECEQVYLSVWDGETGAYVFEGKQISDNACVECTADPAKDGLSFENSVHSIVWNGEYVYVAWTTKEYSEDNASCGTTVGEGFTASIQGYNNTSTAEALWNSTLELLSEDNEDDYTAAGLGLTCSSSNDAETLWCVYADDGGTEKAHMYVTVNVTAGTKGSATTIATDSEETDADTDIVTTTTYTLAGFLTSQVAQGIILNEAITVADDPVEYTNTLNIYNLTTDATTGTKAATNAISGYDNDVSGQAFMGYGISYGDDGYLLLDIYTDDGETNFGYKLFFSNGTANGSRVSIGTTEASGNPFLNADNALWAGVYTLQDEDSAYTLWSGYVKQILDYTYSASNALVSVFALLSVMIAALFAF